MSQFDPLCVFVEKVLLAVNRPVTKQSVDDTLSAQERNEVGRLMRINHVGEVCAQGLYLGAEYAARDKKIQKVMSDAREEEVPHMTLLERRLGQLEGRVSYGLPIWYSASFGLGYIAGIAGDDWSLGFVAETERQVAKHLEDHLSKIPDHDQESRLILEAILADEMAHQHEAEHHGARILPQWVRNGMACAAELMRQVVYRV